MLEKRLAKRIQDVGRRLRWLRLLRTLSLVWLIAALVGVGLALIRFEAGSLPRGLAPAWAFGSLFLAAGFAWRALARRIDPRQTARRIEACYPDLDSRLLAAIEQRREARAPRLGYLQTLVVSEALDHARRNGWRDVAPVSRSLLLSVGHCLALMLFVVALVTLVRQQGFASGRSSRAAATDADVEYEALIEPGDVELERGTSLLALARFPGPSLPAEVTLIYQPSPVERQEDPSNAATEGRAGPAAQRLAMSKSLDDPLFAGRVADVQSDLTYSVAYGDQRSPEYHVHVFDYPELQRADIKIAFPSYTGMADATVEDTLQVTAVEGSQLSVVARLNKRVVQAQLTGDGLPVIELVRDPVAERVYTATFPLFTSCRYKLQLRDEADRANKQPPEFVFTALANRRPEIKLVFPGRDAQVSPLEEIELQASVWDDFGLSNYGIAYSLDGQPAQEIELGQHSPPKERRDARRLVSFEELSAEPDQLLSYYFYADDVGPNGQPRRTSSDMFFCEVRPFEEIFRQGQPPPPGSAAEAANDSDKLAELQKQVITATWKVIRRESSPQPTPDFARDLPVLLGGEEEVLELADQLEEKLKSEASRAHLETARKQMRLAIDHLRRAGDEAATPRLSPALAAEQAAYQALLKLRAREHQVARSNRSQSSSSSGRSAEQLNELELKNTENRYEQQRAPEAQDQAAQRETREILNRLREMAQRQQDLNTRIKQMQASLDAAQSEPEQEEIRRQLKRLRDEEQQILRDADELRNRMEQPSNQPRMAEAKQQLDQTRSSVRQASEALAEGKTSQAAAAGARAEQQMEQLRDEFRKQAAGRFSDEMRHMRDDARRLEQTERELGEKLAELQAPKPKSLRESSPREALQEQLQRQSDDARQLIDSMRKTVEEAESAEPLLSKQLYDTIRRAHQQRPAEGLDAARGLLDRGFVDQARQEEQKAREGVSQMRAGVERAADSVLGDEAEGLRRARDRVDELAQALDDEMRRARGQPPRESGEAAGRGPDRSAGKPGASTGEPAPSKGKPPRSAGQSGPSAAGTPDPSAGKPAAQASHDQANAAQNSSQNREKSPAEGRGDPDAADRESSGQQAGEKPGDRNGSETPGDEPGANAKGANSRDGNQRGANAPPPGAGRTAAGRGGPAGGPLTGADFRPWAEGLRDVEEMVADPELRAQAAQIRDRASAMRAEFKRHAEAPNWDLVRDTISKPLAELRQRLSEDLLQKESRDALVPLDRDPVPRDYTEQVRRYYERLGSGK